MGQVNGRGRFRIYTAPRLLDRFSWNLKYKTTSWTWTRMQNSGAYVDLGGLGNRQFDGWNFFLSSSRTQVASLGTSPCTIRHYTLFPPRKCLLGVERWNLKFDPFYPKKRKNCDFKAGGRPNSGTVRRIQFDWTLKWHHVSQLQGQRLKVKVTTSRHVSG